MPWLQCQICGRWEFIENRHVKYTPTCSKVCATLWHMLELKRRVDYDKNGHKPKFESVGTTKRLWGEVPIARNG